LLLAPHRWLTDSRYVIVDMERELPLELRSLRLLPNPVWEQQGLCVASYAAHADADLLSAGALLCRFRLALIRGQLDALHRAVDWCHSFLSSRSIGEQRLGQHPAVMLSLGRVVRDLYALQCADLTDYLGAQSDRTWLIEEIDTVAEQLIKLAGGRAMLSGQMVQLRTVLLTMNRLYLEDRGCSN
jgi:hypothetical protein